MTASGISLIDANVWLALAFGDHKHHRQAVEWFSNQTERTCGFCRITQLALLRHLTNARIMGPFVQSQRSAWAIYDKFLHDPRVVMIEEPASIEDVFRSNTSQDAPLHALWTDGYLAAFAEANNLQLVTFDKGFERFPNVNAKILTS